MRGFKKQKSRAMVGVCTLIRGFWKERRQQAAGYWKGNDVRTHIGVDVQRHAGCSRVSNLPYDISEKQVETNLHASWAAFSPSTRVIGARHMEHPPVDWAAP